MALFRSFSNQFSANSLTTTSTVASTGVLGGLGALDFGFQASLVKLTVNAAGPAYVQMNGQAATTNDYALTTGEGATDFYDLGVGLSGVAIASTTTGCLVRVGAWG